MIDFKKIKFYIFLFLGFASLIVFIIPVMYGFDAAYARSVLESYGIPQLIYVAWMALATATTLPISVVMIAGIIYFSFWRAMIWTFIGILIGTMGLYAISRWLGRDFLMEEANIKGRKKVHLLNQLIHAHSRAYTVLLSFLYPFPSNLGFMIAGASGMGFWEALVIAVLGNLGTAFGVGLIILGAIIPSSLHLAAGIALILLINVIPVILYHRQLKKVVVLVFSEKAYKRLEKAEKFVEKIEK